MKPLIELSTSRMARLALAALLLLAAGVLHPGAEALAQGSALSAPKPRISGDEFLSVDEAFRLGSLPAAADRVPLVWQIADGYYLYRERIKIKTADPAVQIAAIDMPQGQIKNDEFFGRQEIYHHELVAQVRLAHGGGGPVSVPLQVTYQGCAEAGLCFPPVTKTLTISLTPGAAAGGGTVPAASTPAASTPAPFVSEQDWYARLITGNIFLMMGGFFLAGLALSLTPCVLPMVPILAGIIAGQRNLTTGKAFGLSLTYVLGMAVTYTVAGAVCAAAGQQVQAVFQQTWILVLFAALFVAMALSMFGLFTVQMPSAIQTRIAGISNRQSAGSFGGVAVMGMLSALIVTTCVGPALIGALAVISQTGQIARGAGALFVMSLGMGTPLLIVGASQGRLLPRAGAWMETVKKLFGAMLLAVAAWMLDRVLSGPLALLVWAVPAGAAAGLLLPLRGSSPGVWAGRLVGAVAGLYALVVIAGASLGASDPLSPLSGLSAGQPRELPFQTIKSVADLDREIARARGAGRTVVVDFYADWCTSCKEMQKYTFTDTAVQAALTGTVLLRADVTRNDSEDQALMKRFGIFGPPAIAFYGKDGQERPRYRVFGFMKVQDFLPLVHQALVPPGATSPPS
jgi:thiol:disulfide interchange protein DsbD